jgi:hypothetical protein
MCDAPPTTLRPRWATLYGSCAAGLLAVLLTSLWPLRPGLRSALVGVLVVGTFGAMARWVRANGAALDRLDWCACAADTVGVRAVPAAPQWEHPAPVPTEVRGHPRAAGATLAP